MPDELGAIAAFAGVAQRFCAFCRTRCPLDDPDLMELMKLLAELHGAALALPNVFDEGDEDVERAAQPLPEGAWSAPLDLYWEVFEPLDVDPEAPLPRSLGDDMGELYANLISGLAHYDRGRADAAAWTWRFGFWSRWGSHLTGAQRALHAYFRTLE